MTQHKVRVLLVDDHPTVLLGLEYVLNAAPDIEVVGAERDGQRAMAAFVRLMPEVVVMDLSMPGENGLQVMRQMHAHAPGTSVLVLTSSSDAETVATALREGASGYVLKDSDSSAVASAIRSSARGETPIDSRLAPSLVDQEVERDESPRLTPREREVLELVRLGLANKRIASQLGIRETTVKTYLGSAFQRIGVNDRTSAALWAERHLSGNPLQSGRLA
jgi:DNA-binding NarL/FixJ family response regulator